jgi:heme o synthase
MKKSIRLRDYIELCKPRVITLMVLTAVIAMILACPDGQVPAWDIVVYGGLGIALAAAAGGSINHLIDRRIDAIMARTKQRPIPAGRISLSHAVWLAILLSLSSMLILFLKVNTMVAVLSLLSLMGYAGIYTLILKRATPQNIVIGGLSGAMPPLLGWSAVTGHIDGTGLLLVLIIFTWTPPHFWALAIHRHKEYERANIPMLPVTHGIHFTKINIVLYTLLMFAVTYLAFAVDMFGLVYFFGLTILNGIFLYHVIRLYCSSESKYALKTFHYSIIYLGVLFLVMLVDHGFPILT